MPELVVLSTEGRFKIHLQHAIRQFKGPLPYSSLVKIHFFEQDGTPWMPTPLTAHAKDLFDTRYDRGDILDRAADMATRAHWSPTNLNGYLPWAQRQRQRLHKVILSWTMPPTMWDRL